MHDFNRNHLDPFCYKRFICDFLGNHRWYTWIPYFLKDVCEFSFYLVQDFFGPIDRHVFFLEKIIGPDIIQSGSMVFVLVGEKNPIQMVDFLPDHLLPEVRTCVYNQAFAINLKVDRTPQSFVPVIKGAAHGTVTGYHGYALGSACA